MSDWPWEPVQVPPLAADLGRRRRSLRRALRQEKRAWGLCAVGLLGIALGALADAAVSGLV